MKKYIYIIQIWKKLSYTRNSCNICLGYLKFEKNKSRYFKVKAFINEFEYNRKNLPFIRVNSSVIKYNFKFGVCDWTSNAIFEACENSGKKIVGCKSIELAKYLMESNDDTYDNILKDVLYKRFIFKIEINDDGNIVVDVENLNFDDEIRFMKSKLKELVV